MDLKQQQTLNVLVLGQTPPPYHGQSIAIQRLVQASFSGLRIHHVRMDFSHSHDEIGKFRLGKLFALIRLVGQSLWTLVRHRIDVVHFPPGGGGPITGVRDVVILLCLRPFVRKLLFVVHASGLHHWLSNARGLTKIVTRIAFGRPDAVVELSGNVPSVAALVKAKRTFVIPNGIPDDAAAFADFERPATASPTVLYVGAVRPEKGIETLVRTSAALRQRNIAHRMIVVGEFRDPQFEADMDRLRSELKLTDTVEFAGRKVDQEKWKLFREADMFCFPSHYPHETFPTAVVEAMMFGLPVVASRWRGAIDAVVEGETGMLIASGDPLEYAQALEKLIVDRSMRMRYGTEARKRYLREYHINAWTERIEQAFRETAVR